MIGERPISEQDLHAYVDGFLDPARRASVERYLADHPQQAERMAGWQAANEALRQAVAWKAEEPVPAALNVHRLVNTQLSQRWTPWRMAASILVALAVGAGAGWYAHTPSAEGGIASVGMEASMAQRVFATDRLHPVEFTADEQAQLVKWASARLGRSIAPPDLTRAGYQLLGGRIIATEHGPACMFLYQNGTGGRISLFLRPMHRIDLNAKMQPVQGTDTTGFVWSRNGMGFGLVASDPVDALHELANRVRNEMASKI